MANPLVPCVGCGRHVRVSESDCPFCGHTLSEAEKSKVIPSAAQRMGRNAMFVFATTVALGACSPAPQPAGDSGSPDAQADAGGIIAMYGAPAPDAQAQPDAAGPNDDGGNMALYGSPVPVDASPDSALNDGGGVAPLYGGPVPNEDAGGDGNPGLRYGAPPPSQDV
jgi:hypothetical protein